MSQTRLARVIAQSIVFHIDNYIYKKMSYTTKLILFNYGEVSHRHFQSKYIRKTLLDQQCLLHYTSVALSKASITFCLPLRVEAIYGRITSTSE